MLVLRLPARFPLNSLIALLLGVLHAAGFVADSAWPLEIAALTGLVALVARHYGGAHTDVHIEIRRRQAIDSALGAARLGFAFGLGWFLSGISWIFVSLHTYGEMNALIAAAATFVLCAYLALYPALAGGLTIWLVHRRNLRGIQSSLAFAAFWALSEIARGVVFTGFPWLASGYAHVASPLAGYGALIGVYGIGLLAALIASLIAELATTAGAPRIWRRSGRPDEPRPLRSKFALILIVGVPLAGMALNSVEWTAPEGAPIRVRLLQGSIPQEMKFDEEHFDSTIALYFKLIEERHRLGQDPDPNLDPDLIVLPETAFPQLLSQLPDEVLRRVADDADRFGSAIAFGVPVDDTGERYFNSVIALTPGASAGAPDAASDEPSDEAQSVSASMLRGAQRYDKSHLVPFGEFVPYGFHWFVRLMRIPLGDFSRGGIDQQPMVLANRRIAFNICYEDLFGELIRRQAATANVLINVSNVAWFGDSLALPQHLQISRMRAIETGKPMLRATNSGMTAAIDPKGRVLEKLPPFRVGTIERATQGMNGVTPYVRFGDAIPLALAAAMLAVALLGRPRPLQLK